VRGRPDAPEVVSIAMRRGSALGGVQRPPDVLRGRIEICADRVPFAPIGTGPASRPAPSHLSLEGEGQGEGAPSIRSPVAKPRGSARGGVQRTAIAKPASHAKLHE